MHAKNKKEELFLDFEDALTFAATAEVVRYFKAKPVFVDIEPDTMNRDPQKIEDEKGRSWEDGEKMEVERL